MVSIPNKEGRRQAKTNLMKGKKTGEYRTDAKVTETETERSQEWTEGKTIKVSRLYRPFKKKKSLAKVSSMKGMKAENTKQAKK